MADWTLDELKAERGNIFDQMARLTESNVSEGGDVRSKGEKKIAQLERQLEMINRQIARLTGSVTIGRAGIDDI